MAHQRRIVVAVIGPGDAAPELQTVAEQIGVLLGQAGAVVVTGGLAGVMEAAARGARSAGGLTVGFLPGDDARSANPSIEVAIPTGFGEARNVLVVGSAHAVVAVGGNWGTMSEIALARKRKLPVASVSGWDLSSLPNDDLFRVFHEGKDAAEWALEQAHIFASP